MIRLLISMLLVLSVALAQGSKANLTYTFTAKGVTGPTAIAASGYQKFSFVNNSKLEVDFFVAKLRQGTTLEAFMAADKAVSAGMAGDKDSGPKMGKFISLADVVGGTNQGPMSKGSAYLNLTPGTFVLVTSSGGGPGDPYKPFYQVIKVTQGEGSPTQRNICADHDGFSLRFSTNPQSR